MTSRKPILRTGRAVYERSKFVEKDRNTAEGCRRRAEADLLAARQATTANERRILEASAARWLKRAELMEQIETTLDAHRSQQSDGAAEAGDR